MSAPDPLNASVLDRAGDALGDYLPSIGAALAVLVIGLILVRILSRGIGAALRRLGVDRLAAKAGVDDLLARGALPTELSSLIASLLRIALTLAVVLVAVSLLGIQSLDEALNEALLFLPDLLAAVGLLLAGLILGSLGAERAERWGFQLDLRAPLGSLVRWSIVAIFAVLALGQVGIPTTILTVLAAVLAASTLLTFTLAFGLGGRDLAREVTAGRYVRSAFSIGQDVTVGDVRGTITEIDRASIVLELEDGGLAHVPNHLLLEGVVRVHRGGTGEGSAAAG